MTHKGYEGLKGLCWEPLCPSSPSWFEIVSVTSLTTRAGMGRELG